MVSQKQELDRIDEIVQLLDERTETPQGLMREHLLAARTYILGEMPEELKLQLELVRSAMPKVETEALRSRIETLLRNLEDRSGDRPR